MPISIRHLLLATALASGLLPPAQAALTISATRIIQTSDKQSSSIIVANPSNQAFAAQTWVNTEADDSTTAVPLIAAPELFRLDPGNKQTVQINSISKDLPNDRESLFYFNVQELPQADDQQANTLSIRTWPVPRRKAARMPGRRQLRPQGAVPRIRLCS